MISETIPRPFNTPARLPGKAPPEDEDRDDRGEEDEMAGYCWDAHYAPLPLEYEASCETLARDPSPDWQIPLRWVTVWAGGLCVVSLGLGSLLKWLLQ